MPLTADQDIADLLNETRTIALVGISDRPDRPSYGVMKTLQDHGYRVLPVNPQIAGEHVHGEFVWARSEEHTSELQSLMRISYAVYCLKQKYHSLPIQTYNHLI